MVSTQTLSDRSVRSSGSTNVSNFVFVFWCFYFLFFLFFGFFFFFSVGNRRRSLGVLPFVEAHGPQGLPRRPTGPGCLGPKPGVVTSYHTTNIRHPRPTHRFHLSCPIPHTVWGTWSPGSPPHRPESPGPVTRTIVYRQESRPRSTKRRDQTSTKVSGAISEKR